MNSRADLALLPLFGPDASVGASALDATAALVMRAQAGDPQAFAQLVTGFQPKVLATAWRLLGNREDALDAAQETFLRAHRYLARYDREAGDFGGWLYRIAINVARSLGARRDGRADRGDAPATDAAAREAIAEEAAGPAAHAAARDTGRMLEHALAGLTGKERLAFVLRDLEGRSTDEVAGILGSSPTTVRVHICSARRKLRDALRERPADVATKGES